MQQTVTINNVTYPGHCICNGMYLFVYLDNMTIIDGFPIFADPAKLEVIHETKYEKEIDYIGYTILWMISGEYGNCNAVLIKG